MNTPNDGGPATPIPGHVQINANTVRELAYLSTGLSIRDYFAGQALVGLLAGQRAGTNEMFSRDAYRIADAMLAEREKAKA